MAGKQSCGDLLVDRIVFDQQDVHALQFAALAGRGWVFKALEGWGRLDGHRLQPRPGQNRLHPGLDTAARRVGPPGWQPMLAGPSGCGHQPHQVRGRQASDGGLQRRLSRRVEPDHTVGVEAEHHRLRGW